MPLLRRLLNGEVEVVVSQAIIKAVMLHLLRLPRAGFNPGMPQFIAVPNADYQGWRIWSSNRRASASALRANVGFDICW